MDKERYLIAVASCDGKVVNCHFGKARDFYIYKVEENENISFWEKRIVSPVCDGGTHNEEKLIDTLKILRDCRYLLVSRIGNSASNMAEKFGLEAFEIPGEIEEAINQLIKYKRIYKLFE